LSMWKGLVMRRCVLAVGVLMLAAGWGWAQTLPREVGGASDAQPAAVLLEQGIYQEETAGNLEAAAKTYNQIAAQAVVTRGLVAQALYRLAVVQVKQKQVDGARAAVERLMTEYPEQKDLIAKAQRAVPGWAGGEAVAASQEVPHRHVATAEEKAKAAELVTQGWKLMEARKFEDADTIFGQALRLDSNSAAYTGMGWALLNRHDSDGAKANFENAIALDPKNAAALNGMAWQYKDKQEPNQAEKYWQRALEVDPKATSPMSGLAQYFAGLGCDEEAISWYDKWLAADPQNADATIGRNFVKQKQAAIKDATTAADEFLKKMDAGQYAESHQFMGGGMTTEQWEQNCKAQRDPLGKVLGRKLRQTSGTGGRGGEAILTNLPPVYDRVLYRYFTQFEHKKDISETVTVLKINTGEWRVVGYVLDMNQSNIDPLRAR
jgi:tetratricopeptide (TPR) repeat protein